MHFCTLFATAVYAIIGGPAVGKTSIAEELKLQGELVVREAATDYIIEQKNQGDETPWNREDFQLNVLKIHMLREDEMKEIASKEKRDRIFTDRGLLDQYVYPELRGQKGTPAYKEIESILNSFDLKHYYTAVFYVHPYNGSDFKMNIDEDDVRHESTDEAELIMNLTYKIYKEGTTTLIEVPPKLTPKERAEFILSKVKLIESSL